MKVTGCFQNGTVVRDLESRDKLNAIRELLEKAPFVSCSSDLEKIEDTVIRRENLYTTGIGHGVAIAHGKTPALDDVLILLGISSAGIDFESQDGKPVHLLFLIANPPEKTDEYIRALSTIARIMRNSDFQEALVTERNIPMIEKLIAKEFNASLAGRCQN